MGFDWNSVYYHSFVEKFEAMYPALEGYYSDNNHSNVLALSGELGNFVGQLRARHKWRGLIAEQIRRLENIGFLFEEDNSEMK